MNLLKIVHIFAIILWLGPLFLLQQLSCMATFELKKLYLRIDVPAMIIALISGGILLYLKGVDMKAGWFHMKMTGVLGLVLIDVWTGFSLSKARPIGRICKILYFVFTLLVLYAVYVVKLR